MPPEPAFWQCPKCKTPNPWASYLTACVVCGRTRPPKELRQVLDPKADPIPASPRRRGGRGLAIITGVNAAIVIASLAMMKLLGERWWPATLLLFSPRWMFLAPMAALVPWAAWSRRKGVLVAQAATLVVILGPMMGLCLPIHTLFRAPPAGDRVRVMSLNRGESGLDPRVLTDLIADEKVDILCIQEARVEPVLDAYFAQKGWHRTPDGIILSRFPIVETLPRLEEESENHGPDFYSARMASARVRLPGGREILVASAHLPTMMRGFQKLAKGDIRGAQLYADWRMRQAGRVMAALGDGHHLPTILAGDFNTPPDSPLMGLVRRRYTSGFEAVGWGYGYTRPSHLCWVGIDRILAGPGVGFSWCRVGPRVGSDHRPILAEVVVPPAPTQGR